MAKFTMKKLKVFRGTVMMLKRKTTYFDVRAIDTLPQSYPEGRSPKLLIAIPVTYIFVRMVMNHTKVRIIRYQGCFKNESEKIQTLFVSPARLTNCVKINFRSFLLPQA